MNKVTSNIPKELRQNGRRLTNQRRMLLSLLRATPQSIAEISSLLKKKKVAIDRGTIYKTLDYFTGLGIVGRTQFKDNAVLYDLISGIAHRHHVVYDKCGDVEDVIFN